MISWKRVGVAVALSPTAEGLLQQAAYVARIFQAELFIIHVGQASNETRLAVENLAATLLERNIPYQICWETGDPVSKILAICEREHIDLLVAGALKKENIFRYYLGTVARKIMRKANCSVLMVTNPGELVSYSHLVLNAEDSPYIRHALEVACWIGRKEKSKWLHVVRELKMMGLALASSDQCTEEEYNDIQQNLLHDEMSEVEKMLSSVPHEGLKVNVKVLSGKSGFELARFAERKSADLLIVGAPERRFSLFDRVFPHDLEYIFADLPAHLLIVHSRKEAMNG
ncbi:MAG: universal stress protein [Cyclobacteriaceae bacterium]|nr:universal stress protein [Cyclobacteriaceae bacterium]